MITVGIDAGHGGRDTGATWPLFMPPIGIPGDELAELRVQHIESATHIESRLALGFAVYLHARLLHSEEPIKPVLLRTRDESLAQHIRGSLSSAAACDLVLSLHLNSGSMRQRGAECYYWPNNAKTRIVGDAILDAMPPPLRREHRRSYSAELRASDPWLARPRAVLGAHACDVVLVEIGYLTHATDRDAIDDPATQAAICSALVVGVSRYRQITESPRIAGGG